MGTPPPGCQVSKELWCPIVENEVGDVYATLVFIECCDPLDAVGDVYLARDETDNGFSFKGPEAICPGIGYGIDDASGEREEPLGREVVFATSGKP